MPAFKWTLFQSIKHQCYDLLGFIGMRDRLRCPKCKAVGTWKPHGGWVDRINPAYEAILAKLPPHSIRATNRRWLCKYCGFNLSEDGEFQCYPNTYTQAWGIKDSHSKPTPKELVDPTWPWRG